MRARAHRPELQRTELVVAGECLRGSERRVDDGIVPAHDDRLLQAWPCHRYMTAYARHGRQASASVAASFVATGPCPLPSAARTPRSPAGNASGSPSARIATYSAVHGPMPG